MPILPWRMQLGSHRNWTSGVQVYPQDRVMIIHEAQGREGRSVLLVGHEAFGDEAPILKVEIL